MRTAVLIPCLNEEPTIADVVREFRAALPSAQVYVFDNRSIDRSATLARDALACVVEEPRRGKGRVLQSMFGTIEADLYLLVDGDSTYPATAVWSLLRPILDDEADMVIGSRLHHEAASDFDGPHRLGNRFFVLVVRVLFGIALTDLLSGYRAFTRAVVERVPLTSAGFQVEAELTIKAALAGVRLAEVPVNLRRRPPGSHSKIRPLRDGLAILAQILALLRRHNRPRFACAIGIAVLCLSTPLVLLQGWMGPLFALEIPLAMQLFVAVILACGAIAIGRAVADR